MPPKRSKPATNVGGSAQAVAAIGRTEQAATQVTTIADTRAREHAEPSFDEASWGEIALASGRR